MRSLHMTVKGGGMPSNTAGMMRSLHMMQDMCRGGEAHPSLHRGAAMGVWRREAKGLGLKTNSLCQCIGICSPGPQGMSSDDLAAVVGGINVANAKCQYQSDADMILGNIR